MATVWKKVLMEGSAIDINDVTGVTSMEKGQILRGDANNDVENIDVSANNIIFGSSNNDALLCSFGTATAGSGGVSVSLTDQDDDALTGTVTFTVDNNAIGTAKIQDNAVTLAKIAHQANAGVMVYDGAGGDPTFLSASGQGNKILKVDSDGEGFTFADASSATSLSVTDSDTSPDTARRRILIAGTTTAGDLTTQEVFGDTEFTYKNGQTLDTSKLLDWNGAYVSNNVTNIYEGADDDAAFITPATAGISGTLLGLARGSMIVKANSIAASGTNDAFYSVGFLKASSADSSFYHTGVQSDFVYNPKEKALKVPNLIVTGTQTTINTNNLQVEDQTIRLGVGAAEGTVVSSAVASGGGIVINIGAAGFDAGDEDGVTAQNVEGDLPRVIWDNGAGTQVSSNSVLGWKAAYKGAGADSALGASTAYGIGVMHVTDQTAVTALGADLNDADLSIGVGAMALVDYDGTPSLYIQTAL